ncbi:MAG TPA: sigma-70 family RNA polymerase sigma factor [Polyangiaceae bacterium]|jgi:RNA polymerase sigma-70 factor (ECF subfamily)
MLRLLRDPGSGPPSPDGESARAHAADPLYALLAQVARGNRVAERTLLLAVAPAVLGVVRRVMGAHSPELEDVCQEASLALLSALPSFRAESSILHFASRVALLTALATRRRRAAREREVGSEPEEVADGALSPAELVDAARRRHALRELLDELPLAQAEVLGLHVVLGYTVEETSNVIGAPVNTVRSRLRRGLAALREELARNRKLYEVVGAKP